MKLSVELRISPMLKQAPLLSRGRDARERRLSPDSAELCGFRGALDAERSDRIAL